MEDESTMARANGSTTQVADRSAKSTAQTKTQTGGSAQAATATKPRTGRHAGPWGASFDGTEPDGKTRAKGLTFERRWTTPGVHPYHEITWEYRTAGIANESGKSVVDQKMAFNSPVWFNVGIEPQPQCSACFINSVQDTMSSIMDLAKTEAMLFKFGSGAGSNLSTIRSSKEKMTGGGTASGPVSFMRGYDAFAGVVKSGGKTRRAAKMVILDAGHPDVVDFIDSKLNEEKKAWALIEAGYDPSFTGEAYGSVDFQNANHSVRVTDAFMQAVEL